MIVISLVRFMVEFSSGPRFACEQPKGLNLSIAHAHDNKKRQESLEETIRKS